eukprot:8514236-Pyramimonas_sp.AAC.1
MRRTGATHRPGYGCAATQCTTHWPDKPRIERHLPHVSAMVVEPSARDQSMTASSAATAPYATGSSGAAAA